MSHRVRSAAARARQYASDNADEADLRATLRQVPILPAPADVDDLVARLEAENVPVPAGPLAGIISDARLPPMEPAAAAEGDHDPFFAPLAEVANSNVPQPSPMRMPLRASRTSAALFAAALIGGTGVILWNALLSADAPPPLAPSAVQPAATPIARPESQLDPAPPAPIAVAEPGPESVPTAAVALPAPELDPASTPSEPALAQANPTEEVAAPAAESVAPVEALAMATPAEPSEPQVEADIAPAVPQWALDTDAVLPVEASVAAPEASAAAPEASVAAPEASVAAPEVSVAAPSIELPEPEPPLGPEVITAMLRPAVQTAPTSESPTQELRGGSLEMTVTGPKPTTRPKAPLTVPFAGVWAETVENCSPATREEGALLTYINARRGRAGDTVCSFRRTRRNGNSWEIAAVCADPETTWRSDVQLSLNGRQLTWTSQKGSTTYVRCRRT